LAKIDRIPIRLGIDQTPSSVNMSARTPNRRRICGMYDTVSRTIDDPVIGFAPGTLTPDLKM
jgi:hypothetical protein